jgi:serine/threonine protein kinase
MVSDYELKFGKLCVKLGLLTKEQVQWAFGIQQNQTPNKALPQILTESRLLTREQVQDLMKRVAELERATRIMPAADPLVGKQLGKCVLDQPIGRGGMGTVYRATHKALNCPFAVKVMPPELETLDPSYVKRFVQEAQIAARINHHNIVRVLDVGKNAELGRYYIVMEYVDGESVGATLRKKGRLPWEEALRIVRDVAEALRVAARHQIVHRDVKPDNIIVTPTGETKLADLGLARRCGAAELELTGAGISMGTPYYMPPEQARDARTADSRSDIYALGASFYHMVTAKVPYGGKSAYEVLSKHENDTLPDARLHVPELPSEVWNVIRKMMAKAPEDRYQTPEELIEALDALASESVPTVTLPAPASRPKTAPETAPTSPQAPPPAPEPAPPAPAFQPGALEAPAVPPPAAPHQRSLGERLVVELTAFVVVAGLILGLTLVWAPAVSWYRGLRGQREHTAPQTNEQPVAPPPAPAPEAR